MTDRELKSALHAVFQKHRDSGVLSQNFKDGLAQYYTSSNPKLYINRMQYFVDLFDFSDAKIATNLPLIIFYILCFVLSGLSFIKNFSLIPLLGLVSCCYLLTGMTVSNWVWFFGWLLIGLVVYFSFGYKNSKLNKA